MGSPFYWHGSIYLIADDFVVPGVECGKKHFTMDRNETVFATPSAHQAANMGAPLYREANEGRAPYNAVCAPFLYLVEPKYLYGRDSRQCHAHIIQDERQCRKAKIVRRFFCEDVRVDLDDALYVPMGDYEQPRIPLPELTHTDPAQWLMKDAR